MAKKIFYLVYFFSPIIYGQKPEYIHIAPPGIEISKSIFSDVEVVDTRFDTIYMGFVQKGAFNRKAPIQLSQSLEAEVKKATLKLIESSSKENDTILINVRNFFLSELTGAFSESGTFIFKAGCYLKQGHFYKPMFFIDTTIVVKAFDVTKKLLHTVNDEFGLFVQKAASFDGSHLNDSISYTFDQVQHIDETEKRLIPVYNVELPQRGLYATYNDFKSNQPTETNFIEEINRKTNAPLFFRVKGDSSKGKEISHTDYYAICDGKQLYISTEYGLYSAIKKDYDFYFIGTGRESANTANVAAASFLFGILGGMLASIPEKATFEFKIDHTTGKFLPIKKISD